MDFYKKFIGNELQVAIFSLLLLVLAATIANLLSTAIYVGSLQGRVQSLESLVNTQNADIAGLKLKSSVDGTHSATVATPQSATQSGGDR